MYWADLITWQWVIGSQYGVLCLRGFHKPQFKQTSNALAWFMPTWHGTDEVWKQLHPGTRELCPRPPCPNKELHGRQYLTNNMAARARCWSWKACLSVVVGISEVENNTHMSRGDSTEHGCALECSKRKKVVQTSSVHITTYCTGLCTTYECMPFHRPALLMWKLTSGREWSGGNRDLGAVRSNRVSCEKQP